MPIHCLIMQDSPPVSEIVIDGFESFEYSQYYPIHHHVAVDKNTDFLLYFTDSELRRKGRMTLAQKRRRQELERRLGRPDPKAIEKDMLEVLEVVLADQDKATVYSDDHRANRRSIKTLPNKINHRRETIAWSKRRQASAERLPLLLVWRNCIKRRREKSSGSPTPAMERGLMKRPLQIDKLFYSRIFRTRCELPPRWAEYYDRRVETRALERTRRHELKLAY